MLPLNSLLERMAAIHKFDVTNIWRKYAILYVLKNYSPSKMRMWAFRLRFRQA